MSRWPSGVRGRSARFKGAKLGARLSAGWRTRWRRGTWALSSTLASEHKAPRRWRRKWANARDASDGGFKPLTHTIQNKVLGDSEPLLISTMGDACWRRCQASWRERRRRNVDGLLDAGDSDQRSSNLQHRRFLKVLSCCCCCSQLLAVSSEQPEVTLVG